MWPSQYDTIRDWMYGASVFAPLPNTGRRYIGEFRGLRTFCFNFCFNRKKTVDHYYFGLLLYVFGGEHFEGAERQVQDAEAPNVIEGQDSNKVQMSSTCS
jgi:hypothetical protein